MFVFGLNLADRFAQEDARDAIRHTAVSYPTPPPGACGHANRA
jgi:hypothetical protein